MNTRQTILVSILLLLVAGGAVWWYLGFSFDFSRFFAASTDVASPAAVVTTMAPPQSIVVSCAPETQSVKLGAPVSVTAAGGDGSYEWFAPAGTPNTGSGNSFSTVYEGVGTKKITVQSARGDSSGNVDSVECTVNITP